MTDFSNLPTSSNYVDPADFLLLRRNADGSFQRVSARQFNKIFNDINDQSIRGDDEPRVLVDGSLSIGFKIGDMIGSPPVLPSGTSRFAHILNVVGSRSGDSTGGRPTQISVGQGLALRTATSGTEWGPWFEMLGTQNTKLVNGYYAPASPVVEVHADKIETQGADEDAITLEHVEAGKYLLHTDLVLSLPGQPWQVHTPVDRNNNPVLYLDEITQADDGTVTVTVREPVANGPFLAGGELMDVPEGYCINLHFDDPPQTDVESEPSE